jgi:hypothetical protein
MELQEPMAAQHRAIRLPWEVWAFAAAAIGAVAVSTVTYGFLGADWYFSTNNIARSLSSAMPFLIAAGVVMGAGRWTGGWRWLVAGAWLLALHGVLAVLGLVQMSRVTNGDGLMESPTWYPAFLAGGVAEVVGIVALAVGVWRARPGGWHGFRGPASAVVAVAAILSASGAVAASHLSGIRELDPVVILTVTYTASGILASGALAIAALRVAPRRAPVPELLIAIAAATQAVLIGASWWVIAAFSSQPIPEMWLFLYGPVSMGAPVVLAIGFASAAYFGPAVD